VLSDLDAKKTLDSFGTETQRGWKPGGRGPVEELPPLPSKWYQSPSGRMIAGALVAVGLSYGLLQLTVTVLKIGLGKDSLPPEPGLGLFYGLQGLAALIAGFLTGVGRRQGARPGAMVGIASGIIVLGALHTSFFKFLLTPFCSQLLGPGKVEDPVLLRGAVPMNLATFYGLPLLYFVAGGIGGLMGRLMFKPAPQLADPAGKIVSPSAAASVSGLKTNVMLPASNKDEKPNIFSGSIAWIRCLFAIAFAIVGGSFGTKAIRQFFIDFTDHMFEIKSPDQDYVTLAEFFALSIFIGGAIAGATTPNGLKQGLVVGVGAGIGMVPFLSGGEQGQYIPFIIISAMFLAPLGGWFGTSLVPPPPPPRVTRPLD
jgi:hypothetical protein